MLKEQNSKSKERIRLEEQRAKYEQKLREQIKKDEKRQRERERTLKLLVGELFVKHLPDYMLYEEAELERIVTAAMKSEDCRSMIELIRSEAADNLDNEKPVTDKRVSKTAKNSIPEETERYDDSTSADEDAPGLEDDFEDSGEEEESDENDDNE